MIMDLLHIGNLLERRFSHISLKKNLVSYTQIVFLQEDIKSQLEFIHQRVALLQPHLQDAELWMPLQESINTSLQSLRACMAYFICSSNSRPFFPTLHPHPSSPLSQPPGFTKVLPKAEIFSIWRHRGDFDQLKQQLSDD